MSKSKTGHYCQYYANDHQGNRRIFSWKVTNRQDAVHCLVRNDQASGWYVVYDDQGKQKLNDRIYATAKNPDYFPPNQEKDLGSRLLDLLR